MTVAAEQIFAVEEIRIPDSRLALEITRSVRDTEPALLFHHSSRVYYWAALAGRRRGLKFDRELLYAAAMFHDMGLTPAHSSAHERFEVDGANAARGFSSHSRRWRARRGCRVDGDRSAHDTKYSDAHAPRRRLVTAGAEMDVLGLSYAEYSDAEREAVVHAHPRTGQFKEDIIQAFYDGIKHKPDTTFGNVKADVLAGQGPGPQARKLLQCNSRIGLEGPTGRATQDADGKAISGAGREGRGTKRRLRMEGARWPTQPT